VTAALKDSGERFAPMLSPRKERGSRESWTNGPLRSVMTSLRVHLYFSSVSLGRDPTNGLSGAWNGVLSGNSVVRDGSGGFSGGMRGFGVGVRVTGGSGSGSSAMMTFEGLEVRMVLQPPVSHYHLKRGTFCQQ
jgi:hypothetical protein